MGFHSILFGSMEPELREEEPDFFHDLQLDYLLEQILAQGKSYQTEPYFYTFPKSKELILYRQQVCRDMESEELCVAVQDFCRRMQESRSLMDLSIKSKGEAQSATYHLQSATLYFEALQQLDKELQTLSLASDGMKMFAGYVKQEIVKLKEAGFVAALTEANRFFSELSFSLSMDPDKLMVTENEEDDRKDGKTASKDLQKNYFEELNKLLGQEPEEKGYAMVDIFPDPLEISYLERILVGLLKKSKPKVFQTIRDFKEHFPIFYSEGLLRFEEEVQFYLCLQRFRTKTMGMGYPMELPNISECQEFFGSGVYDLALVWKQAENDYTVVSNEFELKGKPSFFVVTGPNQGGKTTFARSMGQTVYFSLMGLYANADSFTMPMLQGISTHFEAEETLQSNSGKLKEEINRLLPMMSRIQNKKHFVILNELFTTATTHDAMLMGRKVMESFLKRECYGIYVTHIQELAEETEQIISLVAQLKPGEEGKRSYRMLPMKAQGYGYSDALVKKFRLEYDDIIRRLS